MADPGFPKPVEEIVATLADVFRHQGRSEIVEIVENANASFAAIHYDNWNGGTTTWALRLEVPASIFARLGKRLSDFEKEILEDLSYTKRLYPDDPLGEVTISPLAPGASAVGYRITPSESDVRRIWPGGRFRLFLSHVSTHKVAVSKLKAELYVRGVDAFVAHEDIEPSREWQNEIELGLRSMHALAALITTDFHESHWTDQEIGWALGRGVLVQPVRLGANPYGFIGKVQAISGTLEDTESLADALVAALLLSPQTHPDMRRGLATAFCDTKSHIMAQSLKTIIMKIADFTDEEKALMVKACSSNNNVVFADSVPEAITRTFGNQLALEQKDEDDVAF